MARVAVFAGPAWRSKLRGGARLEYAFFPAAAGAAPRGRFAGALVELGRHEDALPELQRLVAAEPLKEELVAAVQAVRSGRW